MDNYLQNTLFEREKLQEEKCDMCFNTCEYYKDDEGDEQEDTGTDDDEIENIFNGRKRLGL